MSSHSFYVDEAGNAGINYLDDEQPFHVAAGVMIANEQADALRTLIKQACGGTQEMKAARRLGSNRGRRVVAEILEAMGAARALPFFGIMERKFSLVGKIVDVFLDPDHHGAVDWLPTHAIQARRELTEALYDELPAEILRKFAEAYRAPSEEGFTYALDSKRFTEACSDAVLSGASWWPWRKHRQRSGRSGSGHGARVG